MTSMMACGHAANAQTEAGDPCCVICVGIHPGAETVVEPPDLTGRMARCTCGREVPSQTTLAFFDYRGPGSRHAASCKHCHYAVQAHVRDESRVNPEPSCGPGLAHECPGYEPGEGNATDSYYCGCRGWD